MTKTKDNKNEQAEFLDFVKEHKNTVSHPRQNEASKVQKEETIKKIAKK